MTYSLNYLVYPTKTIGITQSYLGTFSHEKSYKGKPQSFPIDEACSDTGRDWFITPCDEIEVMKISGLGNASVSNTIWLQSTSKVQTPTFNDFITIMLTHPNDDDVSKIKVGQKFTRGTQIVREGTNGYATGNHFHIEIAQGLFKDLPNGGWVSNSLGAWVISANARKPEECFFITDQVVKNTQGIKFIKLIGEPKIDTTKDQVEILATNLRIRKEPNGEVLGYIKKGMYNIDTTFKQDGWLKTDYGYIGIGDWLIIHEAYNPCKEEIKILENKIQELLVENDKLNLKIKQLENNKFSFIAPKTGTYRIKLYENENLIIK
jgi:hypothetical protein